jgi:amphi-Trp domain-containing protein
MASNDTPPETDRSSETDAESETGSNSETASGSEAASEPDRATIRAGRDFDAEYRLDAATAGAFLVELGEQLRDDRELTLVTDEWELPFAFGEPVNLDIDFEGVGEQELEIELELPGRSDEEPPEVE